MGKYPRAIVFGTRSGDARRLPRVPSITVVVLEMFVLAVRNRSVFGPNQTGPYLKAYIFHPPTLSLEARDMFVRNPLWQSPNRPRQVPKYKCIVFLCAQSNISVKLVPRAIRFYT